MLHAGMYTGNMDKKEKELLVDPGDWYSELFKDESDSRKIQDQIDMHGMKEKGRTATGQAGSPGMPGVEKPAATSPKMPRATRADTLEGKQESPAENNAISDIPNQGHGRRKRKGIPVYVFFSSSVLLFILCVYYLFQADNLRLPDVDFYEPQSGYVASYLTYSTKQNMSKNVLHLLRENRIRLETVQNELKRLEEDKAEFIRGMEQKEKIYLRSRSIFSLTGTEKNLRSIADLVRMDVEFRGEKRRRTRIYLDLYNSRKESLLAQKREYEKAIDELTEYQKAIDSTDSQQLPDIRNTFLIESTGSLYLEKFLNSLENDDYKGALSTLRLLGPLSGEDRTTMRLVNRLVTLLREYHRRLDLLTGRSPFAEISMAYLNEDYDRVEKKITDLRDEAFLKPILSGIDGSLFVNRGIKNAYEAEIGQKARLADLVRRAESFERQKEYKKALDIYENLLVFKTGSYDREMILKKIRSDWLALEQERLRRSENTQAIKYIDSARILSREGKDADALRYYRLLLKKCPNSDYTEEAVEGIIRITSLPETPG